VLKICRTLCPIAYLNKVLLKIRERRKNSVMVIGVVSLAHFYSLLVAVTGLTLSVDYGRFGKCTRP